MLCVCVVFVCMNSNYQNFQLEICKYIAIIAYSKYHLFCIVGIL